MHLNNHNLHVWYCLQESSTKGNLRYSPSVSVTVPLAHASFGIYLRDGDFDLDRDRKLLTGDLLCKILT